MMPRHGSSPQYDSPMMAEAANPLEILVPDVLDTDSVWIDPEDADLLQPIPGRRLRSPQEEPDAREV